MLGGRPLTTFVQEHWGKRPLFSDGANARDRWGGLFDRRALESLLATRALPVKAAYTDLTGQHAELRAQPREAMNLFDAGMTLCVEELHRHVDALGRLAAAAKLHMGAAGVVVINGYLSPPGKGFGLHFDSVHVFIMQVEGEKEWHFSREPALANPPRNLLAREVESYRREQPWARVSVPGDEELEQRLLRPGDVLYLPPGTWHRASARGTSLGLTLSLRPLLFSEWVTEAMRQALTGVQGWRAGAPLATAQDPNAGLAPIPTATLHDFFVSRKQELLRYLEALSPEDFCRHWLESLGKVPLPEGLPQPETVHDADRLEVSRLAPIRARAAADGQDALMEVYFMHRRLRLPRPAFDLLQRCLTARSFLVSDAVVWGEMCDVEADATVMLLRSWLRSGLLERRSD
jgi:hypothetical protein